VNEDGMLDLVVINAGTASTPSLIPASMSVLLGTVDGTFQGSNYMIDNESPRSVAVADVNGDSHPDLVVAYKDGAQMSVLLNKGGGTFPSMNDDKNYKYYKAGSVQSSVAVADLNGDGHPDVVVANAISDGTVSVLLNNGDGTFPPRTNYGAGALPASVAVGDVNGDGAPDLALANNRDGTVSVLLGNGDGTFRIKGTYWISEAPDPVAAGE